MRCNTKSFRGLAAIAVMLLIGGSTASATLIDVNQAFINFENANSGPTSPVNGNFVYGTADTSQVFTPYPAAEHTDNLGNFNANIQGYNQANGTLTPFTVVNVDTANAQTICCGIVLQPGEIGLHPDGSTTRQFSVIAWTAPSNGTFTDSATYHDRGGNGSTAVYLLDPSGTQASTSGASPTLTSSGSISAGQTIAFAVGLGTGGFGANSTGLYATINFTPVPEPNALLLFGFGIVGLAAMYRRRCGT